MNCEDIEELISGYVDGELTQQEAQKVSVHIESCAKCRKTCSDLKEMKEKMGQLSWPKSDLEVLDQLENELVSRSGRWSGWILLLLGIIFLAGFGVYEFFTAPGVPWPVRFGYGAIMLGNLVLFIIVLRQRMMTYKNDKYRKVKL